MLLVVLLFKTKYNFTQNMVATALALVLPSSALIVMFCSIVLIHRIT